MPTKVINVAHFQIGQIILLGVDLKVMSAMIKLSTSSKFHNIPDKVSLL